MRTTCLDSKEDGLIRCADEAVAMIRSLQDNVVRAGLIEGRSSGCAVFLNAQVVRVHVHVEEAVVSPVSAPRVAANPVLLSIGGHSIANNSDLVVDLNVIEVLLEDGRSIVVKLELLSCLDTAGNGAVLELSLHLVSTRNVEVLTDVVASVGLDGSATINSTLANGRRRPGAVTAHVDVLAASVHIVVGSVVDAAGVHKASVMSEFVDLSGVSTVARATSIAVDNHLGVNANWRAECRGEVDVESVSNGAGRTLGPARATVLGNVLVLVPGKPVCAILVSPVESRGQVISGKDLVHVGCSLLGSIGESAFRNTAACRLNLILQIGCLGSTVFRLRERIDGLIVLGVILLSVSGLVPHWVRPCVLGSGPGTVALNCNVVYATADAEEALLTPVGAPRVANKQVWLIVLRSITNNRDVMGNLHVASIVTENATSVVMESIRHCNTASKRTALVQLLFHVFLAGDSSIFVNSIDHVLARDVASLTRVAVATHCHG